MKPIAYVSDESYLALAGVAAEFESLDNGEVTIAHSSPRGAFRLDLAPGPYRVTLTKDGFGAKSVECELDTARPYSFRLLRDDLLGYMWPKWAVAGGESEVRIHSDTQCQVTLWRYGLNKEFERMVSWYDEHGPRTNIQITPDGDYTQSGVKWNSTGYPSRHP